MEASAANGRALSVTETAKLENLEEVIDGGLKSFIEVGRALMEIRDGRLHRATHTTFADYCQERWGMSENYAFKHMAAAETVNIIERDAGCTNGTELPVNERQVRPLTRLPECQRASAWKEAKEASPNGKPTAAIVEQVVASRLPESDSVDDEEAEAKPKKSKTQDENRWEREAREFLHEFRANVAKVSDGAVYTTESLSKAVGTDKATVSWFVRMCEVYPAVKVHRSFGRKSLIQYTFEKTNCVTGHDLIKKLARQIADDQRAGSKAQTAAQKILSLLGG
jgi:hypothetical protein